MATTTMTVTGERWLDEVLLEGLIVDVAGADFAENFRLPAGLGDVALMNLTLVAFSLDVFRTTTNIGWRAEIRSIDATTRLDNVGAGPLWVTGTVVGSSGMAGFIDPDALVLWRQTDLLTILGPELDTDATPTGDLSVIAKVVRVRPIEQAGTPLQLVR